MDTDGRGGGLGSAYDRGEVCYIAIHELFSGCYFTGLFHHMGSHIGQEQEEVEKGEYGVVLASLTGSH